MPPLMILLEQNSQSSQIPPWVSLTVAVIGLLGVIITAIVVSNNASATTELQAQLAKLDRENKEGLAEQDREHKEGLAKQEREQKDSLAKQEREHKDSLAKQERDHNEAMTRLEAQLREEFSRNRLYEAVNQKETEDIRSHLVLLRNSGHIMFGCFERLAAKAHEFDDRELVVAVSKAVAAQEHFREEVVWLDNQHALTREHRRYFDQFHDYLILVLLDVARTKEERLTKSEALAGHVSLIGSLEDKFVQIIDSIIRPYRDTHVGAASAAGAAGPLP